MTARELQLILKVTKAYREVSYGQFDQESSHKVQEIEDAAEAIEFLLNECGERRRDFMNLMCYLQTSEFKAPATAEAAHQRMLTSGI